MIPFLLQTKDVTAPQRQVFEMVERMVRLVDLPDVTCHELAEAVTNIFPAHLRVQHGWFVRPTWTHSWVEFYHSQVPKGWPRKQLIIDVYPWAQAGGPNLLLLDPRTPWKHLFTENGTRPTLDPKRVSQVITQMTVQG